MGGDKPRRELTDHDREVLAALENLKERLFDPGNVARYTVGCVLHLITEGTLLEMVNLLDYYGFPYWTVKTREDAVMALAQLALAQIERAVVAGKWG